MADKEQEPPAGAPHPARKRRRPSPTIDLKATEVSVEPKENSASDAGADAPAAAEPVQWQDAPPASSAEPEADKEQGRTAETEFTEDTAPPGSEAIPESRPSRRWPQLGGLVSAGLAGGGVALLAVLLFWAGGFFSQQDTPPTALEGRLAAMESRLREMSAGPAAAIDPKVIEGLASRMTQIEAAARAAPPNTVADPASGARRAAVEEAIRSLQGQVTEFQRRADDTATATREARGRADAALLAADAARSAVERSDIAAVAARLEALERSTKSLADNLAKSLAASADRPLRLAVSAQALRAAVERGDAFAAELAAVKPLVADAQKLRALEPFADSGVPAAAALARELSELTPAMLQLAAPPTADGGFLDRLQANAARLVRIRPVDETSGDEPSAIISRVGAKAARGDIAGALADLSKLPAAVRAPAEEWMKKAQAREAAVNASRQLVHDALAALAKPSP